MSRSSRCDISASTSQSSLTPASSMRASTGDQRQIDLVVHLAQSGLLDFVAQFVSETQREVGGFADDGAHLQIELAESSFGQAIRRVSRVEQIGVEQGIVLHACERDTLLRQNVRRGLWIVHALGSDSIAPGRASMAAAASESSSASGECLTCFGGDGDTKLIAGRRRLASREAVSCQLFSSSCSSALRIQRRCSIESPMIRARSPAWRSRLLALRRAPLRHLRQLLASR